MRFYKFFAFALIGLKPALYTILALELTEKQL